MICLHGNSFYDLFFKILKNSWQQIKDNSCILNVTMLSWVSVKVCEKHVTSGKYYITKQLSFQEQFRHMIDYCLRRETKYIWKNELSQLVHIT